jgi:glycosyltransferase involved in cell wall biosynthesis
MRGITPWHDARRLRAAATLERLVLRQCRYVAGRTAFDERVAAVLAPQASYMHVGEVLRNAFYGPRWEGGQERRGRIPVLCAIGSEYSRKGVDTAIEAVRILLDSGCKARLRVFGAKPDSTAARLAVAHAERLGISEMICLSGKLNAADVVAQLLAADVYLHPSRADNSPNALCEAMMLGVPCVASTAGGIPSLATDGQDALLVPPGDAYSLAGAVRTLLADGRLAARLSETARDRATARHDPETVREQLLAAYASTLATPASGGAGRHDVASDRCPS